MPLTPLGLPRLMAAGDRGPGRLRVLLVTHSLAGGGAERFVATLASRLDRDMFAPAVCAATAGRAYPVPADVPVATLGYRGLRDLPRTVLRLAAHLRRAPPDVVLSNVLSTNGLTGAALALARGRAGRGGAPRPAWVARVGNSPEHGDPLLQRWWGRRIYPRADLVVTNSRGLGEGLVRYYPGLEERWRTLGNPTDFERIEGAAGEELPVAVRAAIADDLAPGRLRIVWVGRLEAQKRPDLAVETLARVRDRLGAERDARLWMCGDGSWRARLEARIADLGLTGAVRLLGFQDNPFPLMRAADLFLSTSDFEGLPNALIEAQGLGLPAVATRCPFGPEEIVDPGETGLLAPIGDAPALAEAVVTLAQDGDRRRAMGAAARGRARDRFGLDEVLPRWEALLLDAAAAAGGRG